MLKIRWTAKALMELSDTLDYIEQEWGISVAIKLNEEVILTLHRVVSQPSLGKSIESRTGYRKINVMKFSSLFYKKEGNEIQILTFFSNRQNPQNKKL